MAASCTQISRGNDILFTFWEQTIKFSKAYYYIIF